MGREEMGSHADSKPIERLMRIAEEASSTWAHSIAPVAATQHNFDSPYQSQDRHYALHGKVTMLVLILIFCIFLLLLSFLPCLRRLCGGKSSGVPIPWECCPLVRKGKDGSGAAPSQTEEIPKDNTGRLLYF